jgi:YD repeat-containing protein
MPTITAGRGDEEPQAWDSYAGASALLNQVVRGAGQVTGKASSSAPEGMQSTVVIQLPPTMAPDPNQLQTLSDDLGENFDLTYDDEGNLVIEAATPEVTEEILSEPEPDKETTNGDAPNGEETTAEESVSLSPWILGAGIFLFRR